jgi:hypothetical protein
VQEGDLSAVGLESNALRQRAGCNHPAVLRKRSGNWQTQTSRRLRQLQLALQSIAKYNGLIE